MGVPWTPISSPSRWQSEEERVLRRESEESQTNCKRCNLVDFVFHFVVWLCLEGLIAAAFGVGLEFS
jgi:hypothetical protein